MAPTQGTGADADKLGMTRADPAVDERGSSFVVGPLLARVVQGIRAIGVGGCTFFVLCLTVGVSVAITTGAELWFFGTLRAYPMGLSVICPLIITPPIAYGVISLLFKLDTAERQMRVLATIDGLTGTYNRRTIFEMADRQYMHFKRYGRPFTLLMIDLDHFKAINDQHGHAGGDTVLRAASQVLQQELRGGDSLGRYGGEEFLIVLPETDATGAAEVATRILTRLAETPISLGGGTVVHVTASMGAAQAHALQDKLDGVLEAADGALYLAKSKGRNRLELANDTSSERGARG